MSLIKLVLIRHGESEWNKKNKFTGWYDVELSNNGILEAKKAGKYLNKLGFKFNISYTSILKRAICTLWYILKELNLTWIPVNKTWRLNERHYGSLQGLNKKKTSKIFSIEKVNKWRRSFKEIPPKINILNPKFTGYDNKYYKLNQKKIPFSESLHMTYKRVLPYWKKYIFKNIKMKKNILVVAHGNSLRSLVKYLHNFNDKEIVKIEIPTGKPLIYEFNNNFKIKNCYYINNK
ncbi:2,3-bisphosphoglycerate-dependent phosphoglycerate mutase [Candidatus Annandia adelgestsuga]|uniref:2,3-bisphosphoglycerate-dependent phosphoglycerate mutase n=1 Tax=Candidatus Annandia adelgestsuga TaxID=1302411 RepID=A0A3S5HNY5_9ENTR|nr:2,3-diphosphoglycerate-dependent phosphoglycerate mutase [Candidatus Annandia adelgestsuga]AZP36402.1 2,3-bisphosphoglycerate-dependent phosphoglycerate mutase [Candidatus Annandia adelgestsuga]